MRSTGTARFDLGCEITETGSELEVVWLFREAILSKCDLTELDAQFKTVAAKGCQSPESTTGALISKAS